MNDTTNTGIISSSKTPLEIPIRTICHFPLDGMITFSTRFLRMFNYGLITPVLFLYCKEIGLSEIQTGILISLILAGDLIITLYLSTRADTLIGRRRTLIIGAVLKIFAGLTFAFTTEYWLLVIAGTIGVISSSGGECGPFQAIEQACLTDAVIKATNEKEGNTGKGNTGSVAILFGYYAFVGYVAAALGALTSGYSCYILQQSLYGYTPLQTYKLVFICYAIIGLIMAILYSLLSIHTEVKKILTIKSQTRKTTENDSSTFQSNFGYISRVGNYLGLIRPESIYIIARLSFFFALDSFAGAFVLQTWISFYFYERWNFEENFTGILLSISNIAAGVSGILASYCVKRFGAMLTMIVSHLPSNWFLLAIPFATNGFAACALLVTRFSISQMDVPARQAYVAMAVMADERSAAGGITNIVKSLGAALAPNILGYLSSAQPRTSFLFASPWIIAGVLKCVYDISLYALYLSDPTMVNAGKNSGGSTLDRSVGSTHSIQNSQETTADFDEFKKSLLDTNDNTDINGSSKT
jgi:MFS family permease